MANEVPYQKVASWLPERINLLTTVSENLQEKNHLYQLQQKCNEYKAIDANHGINFLNKNDVVKKNLIINIINDLEDILVNELNNWRKSAKFLGRRRSLDGLVNHMNIETQDYLFLRTIASTLKDLYDEYANVNGELFKHKDELITFIQKLQPTQALKELFNTNGFKMS